ncbi:MAG: T9SS type A sorting domain-containing protein [Flavobacteriales bacterium]
MVQSTQPKGLHRAERTNDWRSFLLVLGILALLPLHSFSQIVETFNSSDSFLVPAGVTEVTVECWGGGGGGGTRTSNGRGGGGGGGAYVRSTIPVIAGNSYTVTVGAGSSSNSPGGDSWFGSSTTVMAKGGSSVPNNSSSGASGGSAAASIGTVKFSGGNGANAPSSTGGGGGSSAGTAANGGNGSNQSGGNAPTGGGDGGNGGNGFVASGNNGDAPGGGGGGAERGCCVTANGGTGGNGRVVITYTPCVGPTVSVLPAAPSICTGGSVTLTASGASAGYTWAPATGLSATSGAAVTASPATTTTYTVTGLNTGCTNSGTAEVTVVVNAGPTAVSANSSASAVCTGGTVDLAGAATNLPSTVFSETFNGGLGSWSTTNTSSGGNPALAAWTSRPNNYFYNGYGSPDPTFSSNDASPFVLSNSDEQGSGTTATTLVSPGFSAAGYSTLSLSYYHYYRYNASESANVDVSTDGSNWTNVQTHTSTQGADNSFVQATVDLGAYAGEAQLFIRFRYEASWDWWWAIDNVVVTGTPTALSWAWTSTPGGYSSGVQNPTGAGLPEDRTFTLTVTAGNGCTASASTGLVSAVAPPDAGTNGTLYICSAAAATSLFAQLGGSPDAGGSWSGPSAVIGGLYDPATMDPGVYTYLVTGAPCSPASATVTVTEQAATAWYADVDGDGFGDPGAMVMACSAPVDHVSDNSDCDDSQWLYTDGDGDGFGTGAPVACGVADNTDCNDAEVHYADVDGDGYGAGAPVACGITDNSDNCPNAFGLIGANCDAQPGPGFALGQLDATCTCVAVPCTENVAIELRTDANSHEAGWEILDQSADLVVCSGGYPDSPFPMNITNPIVGSCCLPVGCYRLRVLDGGGDGFVSGGITGGYQLRESGANGRAIISNFGNFTSGSMSAIGAAHENGAFCLPLGDTKLIHSSCDKMDWVDNKYLVCHADPAVSAVWVPGGPNNVQNAGTGYAFWIYDPNGTYSFRRFRSHNVSDGFAHASANRACHMKVNGWNHSAMTPHIPEGVLLNVRVRPVVLGSLGQWGPACSMMIDPVAASCPEVWLQDDPANPSDYSCGVDRTFGGPNGSANKITAKPPQFSPAPLAGGTGLRYQFRFRIEAEGVCIVRPMQTSPTLHLNWSAASGPQLEASKTYDVEVRVSKDQGATWCVDAPVPACDPDPVTHWGKTCSVTIGSVVSLAGESSSITTQGEGTFALYPNPNNGEQLFISLTDLGAAVNTVSVDIHDMSGKRVSARTIVAQDGHLNQVLDLNGELASGLYMVQITAGDKTYNERLVIQK